MSDMWAGTRLLYWADSLIGHALWRLVFSGAILGLSYLRMIREYNFRLETTILPSEFFAGFVAFFGWLPKLIGFQIPEPDIVISLPVGETSRRAWSVWLLCGVVFYGFIPRVVLAIDSVRRLNRSRRGLTLDLELPYYVKLRQRLDALLRPPSVITDPDLGVPDPVSYTHLDVYKRQQQHRANTEDGVAGHAHPHQHVDQRAVHEFRRTREPVAVFQRRLQLQHAHRQQGQHRHQSQADVEAPERAP